MWWGDGRGPNQGSAIGWALGGRWGVLGVVLPIAETGNNVLQIHCAIGSCLGDLMAGCWVAAWSFERQNRPRLFLMASIAPETA